MTSSSPNRAEATKPGRLARVWRLEAVEWLDLLVAAGELAVARVRLARWDRERLLVNSFEPAATHPGRRSARIRRVRLAIARMGHRVPWRGDCLVQALAARRWLARHGIATELSIGVRDGREDRFEAHAWLSHGDEVVTGGDVTGFVPLAGPEATRSLRSRRFVG